MGASSSTLTNIRSQPVVVVVGYKVVCTSMLATGSQLARKPRLPNACKQRPRTKHEHISTCSSAPRFPPPRGLLLHMRACRYCAQCESRHRQRHCVPSTDPGPRSPPPQTIQLSVWRDSRLPHTASKTPPRSILAQTQPVSYWRKPQPSSTVLALQVQPLVQPPGLDK